MRAYLEQRDHIGDLKGQIALRQASIDDLEREKRRWEDPAFVRQQARELNYVMPGETAYVVLDENGEPLEHRDRADRPVDGRPEGADRVVVRPRGSRSSSPATRRSPSRHRPERIGRHRRIEARRREPRDHWHDRAVIDPADVTAIDAQLGREPRAIHAIGHRCPCGNPDVVTTEPRLPNGTPFPTTYYLTCPRAASRIGTLEGSGLMKEMQDRLAEDPELAAAYRAAHERYLAARAELGDGPRDRGDLGRRHAGPGQVPARARRPVARAGPRREPARRRGARPARRWWESAARACDA